MGFFYLGAFDYVDFQFRLPCLIIARRNVEAIYTNVSRLFVRYWTKGYNKATASKFGTARYNLRERSLQFLEAFALFSTYRLL